MNGTRIFQSASAVLVAGVALCLPFLAPDFMLFQFSIARLTNAQPQAIIRNDLKFFDIVCRPSRHHGVDAARVIPDHASQGAVGMGCRVGAKREFVFFGGRAQCIQDYARLHAR